MKEKNVNRTKVLMLIFLFVRSVQLFSQEHENKAKYIFFLHSRFAQLYDLETIHPQYGRNDYLEIVQEFRNAGFIVISEKRPKHTEVKPYAQKVAKQIDSLLKKGVKPDDITVIGTSMGGYIAQYVSTYLKNPNINFVFIGSYRESDLKEYLDINWCGNILSIYADDDLLGVAAMNRVKISKLKVTRFKEIELHTHLKHGFLYHPLDEWMLPSMQWAKANYDLIDIATRNYFVGEQDTLPYRLIIPKQLDPNKKYPLLVYLHGSGNRGRDNEKPLNRFHPFFADTAPLSKYACYILIPQCPMNDAWVKFPNFPNSLAVTSNPTPAAKNVLALVHHLIETKGINSKRIYLTGFSMGGEGTFDLIGREPELFACAVALASVADTSNAEKIKNIPLWVFHGTDDKINEFKYSKMMVDAIKRKGGKPIFTAVKGVGHDCRNNAYLNPDLWKWVFEQIRKN